MVINYLKLNMLVVWDEQIKLLGCLHIVGLDERLKICDVVIKNYVGT